MNCGKDIAVQVVAPMLLLLMAARTQADCGASDLKGTFGFAGSATVEQRLKDNSVRAEPYVEVGIATYDGAGGASLSVIASFRGIQTSLKARGAYQINAGCTAIVTWSNDAGKVVAKFIMAIVESGAQLETIDVRSTPSAAQSLALAFSQKRQ